MFTANFTGSTLEATQFVFCFIYKVYLIWTITHGIKVLVPNIIRHVVGPCNKHFVSLLLMVFESSLGIENANSTFIWGLGVILMFLLYVTLYCFTTSRVG